MNRDRLLTSLAFLLLTLLIYYRGAIALLPALLIPVAVHELGHLLTIRILGLRVESMGMDVRGLCIRYGGRCTEFGHIAVALAGPAAGLLWSAALLPSGHVQAAWLRMSAEMSLMLTLFNLLPILPLDGGQVFVRLCRSTLGAEAGERLCRTVGGVLLALLLMEGVWYAFMRQASAPLAAGIWLLLSQNEREALVKNGEVL